jgi:hypothetical protein
MKPSSSSTKARKTLDGLVRHLAIIVVVGLVAGCALYWFVYRGEAWPADATANLRSFASTVAQIGAGLGALMFAGLTLLLAFPPSTGLGILKRSGHFFDLCARMALTMVVWFVVVAVGLFVMLTSNPASGLLCFIVGCAAAALSSTLGSMMKLLVLIFFTARQFDPDYID